MEDTMPKKVAHICLNVIMVSLAFAAAMGSDQSVPLNIRTLVSTTAWFNWTHPIDGDIMIRWYRMGDGQRVMQKLMTYVNNETTISATDSERFRYIDFAGSATMALRNVTSLDNGGYSVIVQSTPDIYNIREYHANTQLEVLTEADFQSIVTINDAAVFLSMETNGTSVTLHEEILYIPTRCYIEVNVSRLSPVPIWIKVAHISEGHILPESPCMDKRYCSREITLHSDLAKNKLTYIHIVLDFDVHGLEAFNVYKPILLKARKEDYKWIQSPGHIMVLENTTAQFNWTHSIQYNVQKIWYHKKSDNTSRTLIARFFVNQTEIIQLRKPIPRLSYVDYPGSMSLQLSEVTLADNGIYIARISDLNVEQDDAFSDNTASLKTIPASELQFEVTLGGETFYLNVANNGTHIQLPAATVNVPTHYIAIVDIIRPPSTPLIEVKYKLYDTTQEKTVCRGISNRYEKPMQLFGKHETHSPVEFIISVDYGIQNLGNIVAKRRLFPQKGSYQKLCSLEEVCAAYWLSRPGKRVACAQDDVIFPWNLRGNTTDAVTDIIWSYRGSGSNSMLITQNWKLNTTYIYPANRNRINYLKESNAGFVLHNVTTDDSGLYFIDVAEVDIHDSAQLSVYRGHQLIPRIYIDNKLVASNSTTNISMATSVLIAVTTFKHIVADITMSIEGIIHATCQRKSICTHMFDFEHLSSSPVWIEFYVDREVCGSYHGGIYVIGDSSAPWNTNVWKFTAMAALLVVCVLVAIFADVHWRRYRKRNAENSNSGQRDPNAIENVPNIVTLGSVESPIQESEQFVAGQANEDEDINDIDAESNDLAQHGSVREPEEILDSSTHATTAKPPESDGEQSANKPLCDDEETENEDDTKDPDTITEETTMLTQDKPIRVM